MKETGLKCAPLGAVMRRMELIRPVNITMLFIRLQGGELTTTRLQRVCV